MLTLGRPDSSLLHREWGKGAGGIGAYFGDHMILLCYQQRRFPP